jgi:glycosyltransferase involved in cell wall biosynthesis
MGDRINLCMLAPDFIPVWGGVGSYTVELLKALPENINLHVVTLRRNIPGWSGKEYNSETLNSILHRPINIHYLSTSKETFFYNLAFQIACLRQVPSLHRKYHFDIVHSHLCHMPDVFLKLLGKLPVPTVVTVHGTIQVLRSHAILARSMFGGLESSESSILHFYPIIELLQQKYVRAVDRLIAVSKATKKLAVENFRVNEERVSLVYNGVDTRLFSPANKYQLERRYSKPTVVYIGRVIAKKGIPILIDAIPEVLRSYPETQFLFVGGGNIDFYRDKMLRIGIPKKNYTFIGHIGYFERSKILQEATVFVNPSFFENFSISILEAMSSGCAVIACNVGGNPELINSEENGILTPPFDSESLGRSIIALLENESSNRKMGVEARKTIERSFSSKACAEKTSEVYKQTINHL